MPKDQSRWEFILGALPQMTDATFPYLVNIAGVTGPNAGVHEGSGIRCLLSGRRCIVTAGHVLERASGAYPAGLAISAGYGKPPYFARGNFQFDRLNDLAIYPLPEDYPDNPDSILFWPTERIDRTAERRSTDYLFVHGFPVADSSSVELGLSTRSFPYGAMEVLPEDGLPSTIGPPGFGINFSPAGMQPGPPAWAANPRGLSGSPVWRLGLSGNRRETWSTEDCRLAGIVIEYHGGRELEGRNFLLATDASALLDLAERMTPRHPTSSVE